MPRRPDGGDDYLRDVPPHVRAGAAGSKPTWVSLNQRDHAAMMQLLDRAERAREARPLTSFLRTLLRQDDIPREVAICRRQQRRDQQRQKHLREARPRR